MIYWVSGEEKMIKVPNSPFCGTFYGKNDKKSLNAFYSKQKSGKISNIQIVSPHTVFKLGP